MWKLFILFLLYSPLCQAQRILTYRSSIPDNNATHGHVKKIEEYIYVNDDDRQPGKNMDSILFKIDTFNIDGLLFKEQLIESVKGRYFEFQYNYNENNDICEKIYSHSWPGGTKPETQKYSYKYKRNKKIKVIHPGGYPIEKRSYDIFGRLHKIKFRGVRDKYIYRFNKLHCIKTIANHPLDLNGDRFRMYLALYVYTSAIIYYNPNGEMVKHSFRASNYEADYYKYLQHDNEGNWTELAIERGKIKNCTPDYKKADTIKRFITYY